MSAKRPNPRTARHTTRRLNATLSGIDIPNPPKKGWVKTIREALGMTQPQLANRLKVTKQAVNGLEVAESEENVTLSRLRSAAEALGCELHYVLLPKKPLEEMITVQAHKLAEQKLGRVNRSQALEASAVVTDSMVDDLARELEMNRPADLWDE